MIKHIVLEGGSYKGIGIIGTLKYLSENKYYDINNIQTIYGTSMGAYIGILLCLKMDWEVLVDYIINRPWEKLFQLVLICFWNWWKQKDFLMIPSFVDP